MIIWILQRLGLVYLLPTYRALGPIQPLPPHVAALRLNTRLLAWGMAKANADAKSRRC